MRIAYICADPGIPVFGRKGASRHVQEVIRALLRAGAQVELFATRCEGEPPPDLEALPVHPLSQIPNWEPAAREKVAIAANEALKLTLEQAGPFSMVYERYSLWSFAAVNYANTQGIPCLVEVNAPLILEQDRYRSLVNRPMAEMIAGYLFKEATALIAVSEAVARYLRQFPIERDRVHVVPNGVDTEHFHPHVEAALQAKRGVFTVGFVGTLKPWHGLETLIKAFSLLHRACPRSRLLIVGDGPMREELIAGISDRGLDKAVTMVGSVSPGDVPAWLTSMDVAVAPYSDVTATYFSPLKVYEYMAAGLPVAASRIGQLEILIEDGVTGLLCIPGDPRSLAASLNRLQDDKKLCRRLGQAGREKVLHHHTWDIVAMRILSAAGLQQNPMPWNFKKKPIEKTETPKTLRESLPRFVRLVRTLAPQIRKEWPLLAGAFLAMLAQIGIRLIEPWPLKIVIDEIAGSSMEESSSQIGFLAGLEPLTLITLVAAAMIIIALLRAGSTYFSTVGLALAGNRIISQIRNDLYSHLLRLPLSFHKDTRSGDLITRVTGDVGRLREVAVTAVMPLLVHSLTLAGMLALMFWLNWQLGLLSLAAFPLLALSTIKLSGKIQNVARNQRKREGEVATTTAESVGAIQLIKAFSLEQSLEKHFSGQNLKTIKEEVKGKRLSARLERTVDILIAIGTALVVWYGAWLALRGIITVGSVIVFLSYLKGAFRPTRDLAKYAERLAKATASGERILDILEIAPEQLRGPDQAPAPAFQGNVRFEHVYFAYEPGYFVLEDVNIEVRSGQKVAFVGPSGAGKSTLLALLLRFYDPVQGRVTIDGVDIRGYTLESLRKQISIVLQESVLFALSVKENIAHGKPKATDEEIENAARLANAHDFILSLPHGYDTVLGERGATLSGGQRQRIAIARAAVRNAPVIILDEPATGLDKENAQLVQQALDRVTESRTVFVIAHDLEAVKSCDQIFFIEDGRIAESGDHLELMELDGRYAELYHLQAHLRRQPIVDSKHALAV